MQSVLLTILAALPTAQVLLGWSVLRAPARSASAAPVVVGSEAMQSMAARELRRSALVRRAQPLDPWRVNWRRQPDARLEAASAREPIARD